MWKKKKKQQQQQQQQEFQPVGGGPAVYLRVAGRRVEPETLTENIIPAKGQGSLNSKLKSSPNATLCCLLNGDWLIFTKSCFDYSLKP